MDKRYAQPDSHSAPAGVGSTAALRLAASQAP